MVPETKALPDLVICQRPTLAAIWTESAPQRIELHPLFNVEWLPEQVMWHVLVHEHIHRIVPPREIDGKKKSHPPEFWELERKLLAQRGVTWAWIYTEWGEHLERDEENECVWVKRGWKKQRFEKRMGFEELHRSFGVEPPPEHFTTWEEALEICRRYGPKDTLL